MSMVETQLRGRLATTDKEVMQAALEEIQLLRKQMRGVKSGDPVWLEEARRHLGLREYAGSKHNPQILEWWSKIRAPFVDDETPWCAGYVGGVLESCQIVSTRKANARSYASWGIPLNDPAVGCIVVFWRGSRDGWKGHVAFVTGQDRDGGLLCLGGNQENAVTIKRFPRERVLGYRWPKSAPLPTSYDLPVGHAAATKGEV